VNQHRVCHLVGVSFFALNVFDYSTLELGSNDVNLDRFRKTIFEQFWKFIPKPAMDGLLTSR
jgi:hypothetical protein